jgi:hypothetical protein
VSAAVTTAAASLIFSLQHSHRVVSALIFNSFSCVLYNCTWRYAGCFQSWLTVHRQPRPYLATAVLRQLSPRKTIGSSFYTVNRFDNLSRDPSPNPSVCSENDFRGRSASIKRKFDDLPVITYAGAASASVHTGSTPVPTADAAFVEKVTLDVVKVQSICEKVSSDLGKVDMQPEVASIFNDLCSAVGIIAAMQGEIVSKGFVKNTQAPRQPPSANNMVSLGNISKKQRQELGPKLLPPSQNNGTEWIPAPSAKKKGAGSGSGSGQTTGKESDSDEGNLVHKKFKEAIKTAERSTLLFNLDMGKVPLMSKETMNKKATLALAAMAAKKEKKNTSIPSEDAVAAIDDCLSATTGMDFFGSTTKTYRNPRDPNSAAFCTVPVKYEFKDKDDKARAEKILRDLCDVHCTTPYPVMVRECIKQIIEKVKLEFPENLIKVSVDCNSHVFKIARKEKGTGNSVMPWIPYKLSILIPDDVLDVSIRRVPENYNLVWPPTPRKKSRTSSSEGGG